MEVFVMDVEDGMIAEQYQEVVENLINISRLTGKDNSILFDFHVNDDSCRQRVAMIEHVGSKNELMERDFPMIRTFRKRC